MTSCALRILIDPQLANEMDRRGRERIEALFSKEKIVREYEALYEELLG